MVGYTSARRGTSLQQLTSKQILDLFHVDFHIADFDCIFDITIRLDYRSKDLLDDTWDQTFEGLICDVRSLMVSYQFTKGDSADHHSYSVSFIKWQYNAELTICLS
jgi:hypothetical protein